MLLTTAAAIKDKMDWTIKIKLCGEERANCSQCSIDKRLDCKYDQELNYDRQVRQSRSYKELEVFEETRRRGDY